MHKLILASLLLSLTTALSFAETISRSDALIKFAETRACDDVTQLDSLPQYLAWSDLIERMVEGSIPRNILAQCNNSPYKDLEKLLKDYPDSEYDQERKKIINLIDKTRSRERQGYSASEYVILTFITCGGNENCFSSAMTDDNFTFHMCSNVTDNTSPDFFEISMYENGGDVRYFLPYLLTNCRLMDASGGAHREIHGIVSQIISGNYGINN